MVIDLLGQAEEDLHGLDQALDRLRRGVYGACATCGRPIPAERLAAQPTTLTCLVCAQASAAATSSRVRPTLNTGDPGSIRRPEASDPTS